MTTATLTTTETCVCGCNVDKDGCTSDICFDSELVHADCDDCGCSAPLPPQPRTTEITRNRNHFGTVGADVRGWSCPNDRDQAGVISGFDKDTYEGDECVEVEHIVACGHCDLTDYRDPSTCELLTTDQLAKVAVR